MPKMAGVYIAPDGEVWFRHDVGFTAVLEELKVVKTELRELGLVVQRLAQQRHADPPTTKDR